MPEIIIDGSGTGNKMKVDDENRAWTFSVSQTIAEAAASKGDSYNINTKQINLTSSSESCILYIKNNGDIDIKVLTIGFLMGNSTGGGGDMTLGVVKNPSSGTIITNEVAVPIVQNKNAGSSQTLDIDSFKGVEGDTVTGGDEWYHTLIAGAARPYIIGTGSLVLPKGSSFSVSVTPQAGNTSMDVSIFLSVIKDDT